MTRTPGGYTSLNFQMDAGAKNELKNSAAGNQIPSQLKSFTCLRDVLQIVIGKSARCHGDGTSVLQTVCRQGRDHSRQNFRLEGNKPTGKLLSCLGHQLERFFEKDKFKRSADDPAHPMAEADVTGLWNDIRRQTHF